MKLVLTKDFNKEFFNDNDLSCIIDSCLFISDSNDEILKTAYDNDELSLISFDDLAKCDIWSFNDEYYYQKMLHEPTLEYSTESNYNFYTYKLRIDPTIPCIKNNISKKLRCIGLVNENILYGILYFDEDASGITVASDKVQQINLSLSMDEAEIEADTEITLNDVDDIIINSHLETPDLVRFSADNALKLKVTSNKADNETAAALCLTNNNFAFNTSGAPLIFSRNNAENKPFISLSNQSNATFINNKKNAFKVYSPENKGESYSIFSNNITTGTGSIDINSDNSVHVNNLSNEYSDLVINSINVSSTVTGYYICKGNTVINGISDKIIGDDTISINASGINGKETDFALGKNAFINSNDLYFDNGTYTRSEMNFTTIGSLNASSYNKENYTWQDSNNSILMLGNNISSVNINADNETFLGFSGLASNNKPDSYLIGSFNNPFDASLLTISTGWFDKSKAPRVFKLEKDFVYAIDKPWISRNNLMNIFDDKDIPYSYYEDDTLVTGMINDATCIQLGEDTFITTNEIVTNDRSFSIDDLIRLKNNNTDILYGEGLDTNKVNTITNTINSINAFIIHLHPNDFNGTSPEMNITDLLSKLENENGVTLNNSTIYTVYVVMENDAGNNRWIIDTDNKKKYINNGDVVTCTQLQILNKVILN